MHDGPSSQSPPLRRRLLKRKLSLLAKKCTIAVSSKIRSNFSQPSPECMEQLRALLKESYFPSWYSGVDMEEFCMSPEGMVDFDSHLTYRLEQDRHEFIPWIEHTLPLNSSAILEIGCGTGSATVAMGEQGGKVVGLDIHKEALEVSEMRVKAHGIRNVSFVHGNAADLGGMFHGSKFDLIIFFAAIEHMTSEERMRALRAAWEMLPGGKYLCIYETPNRLWFYDGHTSDLPFFHWLPDELAFEYSRHSPRYPYNTRFSKRDSGSMASFIREGRGFSFHEMDLALGVDCGYRIVSDKTGFWSLRNPAVALKRIVSGRGRRERLLNSYAPERHRGFFREYIDLVIQKPG